MFCIQDAELHSSSSHNHHQPRRILRTFRSHKSLKSAAQTQDGVHLRYPSDASSISVTRSSTESHRPSTSRGDKVVDWDPLRLHPPLATSHPPFAIHLQNNVSQNHHDLRQARSLHSSRRASESARVISHPERRAAHSRTVIYDGFDFGFDHLRMESPRSRREPTHDDYGDDYPGRPSSPSSSIISGSDFSGPATPSDVQGLSAGWGGVVTPRPHLANMDAADYFIKRGDWKRRGIVFEPEVPMASEEECFDLEMD